MDSARFALAKADSDGPPASRLEADSAARQPVHQVRAHGSGAKGMTQGVLGMERFEKKSKVKPVRGMTEWACLSQGRCEAGFPAGKGGDPQAPEAQPLSLERREQGRSSGARESRQR